MSDPQTAALGLYQPTRGSDPGTWDQPVNANTGATDSLFTNVAAITLSNANVTLSTPPNSGAAWTGPYQSQSALIRVNGVISANCAILLPRPGFFLVENLCTVASGVPAGAQAGTFAVVALGSGGGGQVGIPPNKKQWIFYDGTNVDYIGMPEAGTAYDLHGATALPSWMAVCTVAPYLLKNGANYTVVAFPALYGAIANQFGGTPSLNFNVPDELARARIAYDTVGTNRLTTAISGVNGATMGSAGGNQSMQSHTHGATSTDSGHTHPFTAEQPNGLPLNGGGNVAGFAGSNTGTGFANITTTIFASGAGASQNVQPSIISFLPLIKT